MTAPSVRDPEVSAYLTDVRAALDDLPPDDREELLEGLEADLTELRAESGGSLPERLGSPAAYAAELRSAAGLPPHRPVAPATIGDRLREAVRPIAESFRGLPGAGPVGRFLGELRPAWWVLRGYLAAWAVCAAVSQRNPGVVPRAGDSVAVGLLLVVGAVVVSVWLAHQWRRAAGIRVATVVVNAVVLFSAMVNGIADRYPEGYELPPSCCGLISPSGSEITDISPPRVREDGTTGQNVFPVNPAPDRENGETLPHPSPSP